MKMKLRCVHADQSDGKLTVGEHYEVYPCEDFTSVPDGESAEWYVNIGGGAGTRFLLSRFIYEE